MPNDNDDQQPQNFTDTESPESTVHESTGYRDEQPTEETTPVDSAAFSTFDQEPATTAAPAEPTTEPGGPSVNNQPDTTGTVQSSNELSKQKKSKKPLLLAAIIVAVLAVLAGSGYAVYAFWYQNPDKVVLDSFRSTLLAEQMTATSSVTVVTKEATVTLKPDVALNETDFKMTTPVTLTSNSQEYDMLDGLTINLAVITQKSGDSYVKFSNILSAYDGIIDAYIQQVAGSDYSAQEKQLLRSMVDSYLKPILESIDGQWIKSDASSDTESAQPQQCLAEAIKLIEKEDNVQPLAEAYSDNRFIVVEKSLGEKNGNLGYRLSYDEDKAEAFSNATENTKIAKALNKCSDDDEVDASDDDTSMEMEVWVSKWSHELRKATISATSADDSLESLQMTIEPDFEKDVTITPPESSKSYDELNSGLQDLFGSQTPAATEQSI